MENKIKADAVDGVTSAAKKKAEGEEKDATQKVQKLAMQRQASKGNLSNRAAKTESKPDPAGDKPAESAPKEKSKPGGKPKNVAQSVWDTSENETAKASWAAETVATVKGLFADGINIDTEDAISPGDVQARDGLTAITKRARTALDEAGMKSAVVSFDVGWMPGVDGRFYDHQGLAEVCDYLVVMGYGT